MENRTAERRDVEFAARCVSMGKSSQAHLLNISPNGCLITTAEPMLESGKPMRLKIADVSTLDGKVVWDDGNRAGVEFVVALHPAVVQYIASKTSAKIGSGMPDSAVAAGG